MVVMHKPKLVHIKTCSGMAEDVMGGYFGTRGPDRQTIWNGAV